MSTLLTMSCWEYISLSNVHHAIPPKPVHEAWCKSHDLAPGRMITVHMSCDVPLWSRDHRKV